MKIYIIEFWRRGLSGNEYCHCKPFIDNSRARKHLYLNGYKIMEGEEFIYLRGDMRAVVTEREVEDMR